MTESDDFPTENPYQAGYRGNADAFVSKFTRTCYLTTPTPEGFHTPSPTPSVTPTPSTTPTPPPTPVQEVIYSFPLDSDPGWTTESDWAFGQPTGGGSYAGDPNSGYTGSYVYGYNLEGDYTDNLPVRWLTTNALDCSQLTNISLHFARWLGVESADYDHANIEISTNGSTWSIVWEHTGSSFSESAWSFQNYNLSPRGDGQSEVFFRWGMGSTDGSVTYPGWNIDDIEIWGHRNITPIPTSTPEGFQTPTPTLTPVPTPSSTPTPEGYHTPIPSSTPTPEGYHTPTPSSTPSPIPSATPTPFQEVIYSFPLDTDPGWTTESEWAFGQPQGAGGEYGNPDPSSAYTGTNVYGYNLAGDYRNNLTPAKWLTTHALNCSQITDTILTFRRWLNVEGNLYDHACVELSTNGVNWIRIMENPDYDITDSVWLLMNYDISSEANGQSAVSIRWGMGNTDSSHRYSGWNIDDIEILGHDTTLTPSPTPVIPTPTPSAPQPTPTAKPTAKPTAQPTAQPTVKPTTKPTAKPTAQPTAPPSAAPPWIYDYDGDGTSDIGIFRPAAGLWAIRGVTRVYFGGSTDDTVPGDYDGDGTTDIGIFRPDSGLWALRGVSRVYFGGVSDLPQQGDYDGDGTADTGIFREASGLWAIRGITRVYFGGSSDSPVPGYYNGDSTKDIGIFRSSSGLWAIKSISRIYFGSSGDQIVPGDYDGDGAWDYGVFRSSSGLWAIRGVTRSYFGSSLDKPVPGDYPGEGRDKIGIFRDTSGLWAIRGISRVYFGSSGDIPVTR